MSTSATSDDDAIRAWLESVMRDKNMRPTPFAREAGLAPSTLLRALDPANPTTLERASIQKIIAKFGVPGPYQQTLTRPHGPGFAQDDLTPLTDAPPLFAGLALTANQYIRVVQTRVLELAGYLPGDQVLFDMAATPRTGDTVAVSIYAAGGAETALRLYEAPYVVARTMDGAVRTRPLLVDGENVRIMAVAVLSLRARPTGRPTGSP